MPVHMHALDGLNGIGLDRVGPLDQHNGRTATTLKKTQPSCMNYSIANNCSGFGCAAVQPLFAPESTYQTSLARPGNEPMAAKANNEPRTE